MNTKELNHMPIKAVLVDLDGVLRLWSDDAYLFEENYGLPRGAIEECAFAAPQLLPAIRGLLTDDDWRKLTAKELLRAYPKSNAYTAIKHWSNSVGTLNSPAIRAISKLDSKVKIVLATNATSRLRTDLKKLGILGMFTGIANSSELGFVKPEKEFYSAALEIAGSLPEETIYIDDTLENIPAAFDLGIVSHHFLGVEGMEVFLAQNLQGDG